MSRYENATQQSLFGLQVADEPNKDYVSNDTPKIDYSDAIEFIERKINSLHRDNVTEILILDELIEGMKSAS